MSEIVKVNFGLTKKEALRVSINNLVLNMSGIRTPSSCNPSISKERRAHCLKKIYSAIFSTSPSTNLKCYRSIERISNNFEREMIFDVIDEEIQDLGYDFVLAS